MARVWLNKGELKEFRDHMDKCDERDERNRQFDMEVIAELKQMSTSYRDHMKWEEKDREVHTNVLTAIADRLANIEKTVAKQPSDLKSDIYAVKGDILSEINREYATKTSVQNSFTALKDQLRYIWYSVVASAAVAAWVYANIIKKGVL